MNFSTEFKNKIFNISRDINFNKDTEYNQYFENLAIKLFHYQSANNTVYKQYLKILKIHPKDINTLSQIPFLPVEFFKTQKVITGKGREEKIFLSSGTTGRAQSKHYVVDVSLYEESIERGFELFYGNIKDYCVLALLASDIKNSSLVYMVRRWIEKSNHKQSGFYLNNKELTHILYKPVNKGQKVLLFGTCFSLLDFAEAWAVESRQFTGHFPGATSGLDFNNTIIMETGGMKGRRKEITRKELHNILCGKLRADKIHSEYGMTELLSQAYSKQDGIFKTPPWMKVLIRDINDPLTLAGYNKTGGMNIIDLANIHSCAFIATDDLGRVYDDRTFEVLGRFDNSDVRGCSLIAETSPLFFRG